ncbi:MAG: hypothetical protein Q4D52_04305 [Eubacteriales bacterium]|nr:hypothetical protein [Eubacteriales bacterium]
MNGLDLLEKLDQLDPLLIEEAGLLVSDDTVTAINQSALTKPSFFVSHRFRNILAMAAVIVIVLIPAALWSRKNTSPDMSSNPNLTTGSTTKQDPPNKTAAANPAYGPEKADSMAGSKDIGTPNANTTLPPKSDDNTLSFGSLPQNGDELFREHLQMTADLTDFYYAQNADTIDATDSIGSSGSFGHSGMTAAAITVAQKKAFLEALFAGQFTDASSGDALRSGSYVPLRILLTDGTPLALTVYRNGLIIYTTDLVLTVDEAAVAPFFHDTAAPVLDDATNPPASSEGSQSSPTP